MLHRFHCCQRWPLRLAALLLLLLVAVSGCATITGTATGAFTGAVDLPAETYRANCEAFKKWGILHGLNVLVLGPIGLGTGPIFGFVKGLSIDVQWLVGHLDYGDAFGTYGPESVWRPHTFKWRGSAQCPGKQTSE